MALEPKQILETTNVTPSLTSAMACQQGPAVGSLSGYATIEQIKDLFVLINLTQSQITSLPSPKTGQLAVATDTFQLLVFNGSEWQIAA